MNYLYAADGQHNRVLVYNTASIANGMNAAYVLGQSTWTGGGSNTTATGLAGPTDVNATGSYIYVADATNNRVVGYPKSSLANGMSATVVYGQPDYTSSGSATTQSGLSYSYSLAYDNTSGRLFVGDVSNNRVLIWNTDNAPTPAPASAAQYKSDGTTSISTGGRNNSLTTVFKATVTDPDGGDTNSLCVEAQPIATSFVNQETACGTAIAQGGTASVTISGLIEGGEYHWQARTRDSFGVYSSWVSYGGNSDGPPAATDFLASVGIPADYVYGQPNFTSSSSGLTARSLYQVDSICIDSVHHRLFAPDSGNSRTLEYNLDSSDNFVDTVADHVLGQSIFTSNTGNTTQGGQRAPNGCAYDPVNDRLFVDDLGNNRILVYNTATITDGMNAAYVLGQTSFTTSSTGFTQSTFSSDIEDVAFDPVNNRLFVADLNNFRVLVFNTATITNGMNASYVLGQSTFTAHSSAATQAGSTGSSGVSYDPVNNYLWSAEQGGNRVLGYNLASIANGMNATYVIGQSSFTATTAAGGAAGLWAPAGIDATGGYIYVADSMNNRELAYPKSSLANNMSATQVYGQPDFTTTTSATTRSQIAKTWGVVFDAAYGRLWGVDSNNSRVMQWNVDSAPTAPTGLGQTKTTTTPIPGTTLNTFSGSTQSWSVGGAPNTSVYESTLGRTQSGSLHLTMTGSAVNQVYGYDSSWVTSDRSSYGSTFSAWMYLPSSNTGGNWVGSVQVTGTSGTVYTSTPTPLTYNKWTLVTVVVPRSGLTLVTGVAVYVQDNDYNATGTNDVYVDDIQQGNGIWTNENSVRFTGSVADADSSDTDQLCVEAQPIGTAFTNYEQACGTGVSYSGTLVATTNTIGSLTNNTQYHWQARTKDAYGVYSAWVAYGGNTDSVTASPDFGVDTSAPSTATVYDGSTAGVESRYNSGSLSSLSGNWTAFTDAGSGVAYYTYSIGTSAGATDVLSAQTTSATSFTATGLTLRTGVTYYVNVSATDAATNTSSTVSSSGQLVAPTLTFALSSSTLNLGHLNALNSYTTTSSVNVTTSTNAYNGYVVRQYSPSPFASGANSIAAYSGTYASPTTWSSGTGIGYTTSDTSIQAAGNPFATGTKYAGMASSTPGDIVADHTSTVSGTPISSEMFTLSYKVATTGTQAAGLYAMNISLAATATF